MLLSSRNILILFLSLALVLAVTLPIDQAVAKKRKRVTFTQLMDNLITRPIDDLIVLVGPPSSEYPLSSGGKVYTYEWQGGTFTHARPGFEAFGFQQVYVNTSTATCKIVISTDTDNKIQSWNSEGYDCINEDRWVGKIRKLYVHPQAQP